MKKLLFLTPLLLLSLALPVQAAVWQQGDAVLLSNPNTDDVYAAGGSVNVKAPVTGDVYAAGGDITINQPVSQDVVAAGGTLTLQSTVGDDARLAGGTIIINSPVTDDLVIAGGNITINANVGGDLVVVGGQVVVNGNVGGSVKISAGSVTLNGTYAGPLDIKAGELNLNGTYNSSGRFVASKTLAVQSGTVFNAPIEYYQPTGQMNFTSYLKNNATATYQASLAPQEKTTNWGGVAAAAMGWFALVTLVSAMVVMGLFIGLGGSLVGQIADDLKKHFWLRSAGGLIYFIVLPVVSLILMITLIGMPLGLLSLAIFIFSLIFAKMVTAVILAAWLVRQTKKNWTGWRLWLVAVGFYIILRVLGYIPIVGWLAGALAVCAVFGAAFQTKWKLFKQMTSK